MTCIRCGEPATVEFSIDPDVAPWRSCEGCKKNVGLALSATLAGDEDVAKILLEKPTKKELAARAVGRTKE